MSAFRRKNLFSAETLFLLSLVYVCFNVLSYLDEVFKTWVRIKFGSLWFKLYSDIQLTEMYEAMFSGFDNVSKIMCKQIEMWS